MSKHPVILLNIPELSQEDLDVIRDVMQEVYDMGYHDGYVERGKNIPTHPLTPPNGPFGYPYITNVTNDGNYATGSSEPTKAYVENLLREKPKDYWTDPS